MPTKPEHPQYRNQWPLYGVDKYLGTFSCSKTINIVAYAAYPSGTRRVSTVAVWPLRPVTTGKLNVTLRSLAGPLSSMIGGLTNHSCIFSLCSVRYERFLEISTHTHTHTHTPSQCRGCARLFRILCIDMMSFTENLYTRGAGEVCQGLDSGGLVLALVSVVEVGLRAHVYDFLSAVCRNLPCLDF